MKKLFLIFLGVNVCSQVFAQTVIPDSPRYIIDGGVNQLSVNNLAFNMWAINHYNKTKNPGTSAFIDFAFVAKWDANLHISFANPFLIYSIEIGKRLTSLNSPVTSYINLDFGEVDALFNDLAPLNYTPTSDQQGQQLQLKSSSAYFGLTSRNYFTRTQFSIGKGHSFGFASGFYVKAAFLPFHKHWEYGYYKEGGTDGDGNTIYNFDGVTVNNIPNINNYFFDIGLFIGVRFK